MSVALQIRDVPEDTRDALAAQAAKRGQSLQAYLLALIQQQARTVHNRQIFDRLVAIRVDIPSHLSPEAVIREGREHGFDIDRDSEQR